jgi:Flp pilus assembly pilin Flp
MLVAVVAAALIGMAVYLKRGLCGRFRSVGDAFGSGRQYQEGVTR